MILILNLENIYKELLKLKLNKEDKVVVAVSGGPDSMALLHLLLRYRQKIPFTIICAHVDHNVRKESKDDLAFVKKYCLDNNIVCETMKIENKIDKDFENEARKIRYNFFESVINKYQAKYLFTAHHGDDLIETILMRIVRGSNIYGYGGFKKQQVMNNYILLKPLISVTKDIIIQYNLDNNVPWVEDKTNKEDIHTRNRYRNYILPKLKEEAKNVNLKFLKFSENLYECTNYIDKQIDKIIDDIYIDDKILVDKFNNQDIFIRKMLLMRIFKKLYGNDIVKINDKHINAIVELGYKNKFSRLTLPNNYIVTKEYNYIEINKKSYNIDDYYYIFKDKIILENGYEISKSDKIIDNSNFTCLLNSEEIKLPLIIRNRLDGDFMSIKNMNGTKKIKDIFISSKIKHEDRDKWPLVLDSNNNVVWLPGLKKSKYCKQNNENYDIILRYYQGGKNNE